MSLIESLLAECAEGVVEDVRIGLHWTAVVIEVDGVHRCGLASTLFERGQHGRRPDVPQAGELVGCSGRELAGLARSEQSVLTSLGVAAMNALLSPFPHLWTDANAEQILAEHGYGKRVALVGHFPFVERLRGEVGELVVLELFPQEGDMPAEAAPKILPQAEVVAITAMSLANHTLEPLLDLCSEEAFVMIIGPSTPLHPRLFDWGVDLLSGSQVTNVGLVLQTISQGGNFHQARQAGVRLVNMIKQERNG